MKNLKAAQKALQEGDIWTAKRHIDHLIERMETILHERKTWKPKCRMTENNYGKRGSINQGR